MAEQVYLTVYTDTTVVKALDVWATEESRSRNNLVQLILSNALRQRQTARRVTDALQSSPLPVPADVCADADLVEA